jgi:hypothetical protein
VSDRAFEVVVDRAVHARHPGHGALVLLERWPDRHPDRLERSAT